MGALTASELRQRRDDLIRLRTDGLRVLVDQTGERVEFKSDSELSAAIRAVNSAIQALDRPPVNTILFRTSKGI